MRGALRGDLFSRSQPAIQLQSVDSFICATNLAPLLKPSVSLFVELGVNWKMSQNSVVLAGPVPV